MTDANPEVAVLWRGEEAIRVLLDGFDWVHLRDEESRLKDLLVELKRIRLMRVARWNQRKRAAQFKKRARAMESERLNNGAVELVKRRAQRDRLNGES